MMICICAILTNNPYKGLLLQRAAEKKISELIKEQTSGDSFIFNTQSGIYIFASPEIVNDWSLNEIADYVAQKTDRGSFINTSKNHDFFRNATRDFLNRPNTTSMVWKNFISSFLIQLNPFYGDILPIHSLFKDFVAVLKEYGSEEQLCYLKKKMNVLRSRITVDISLY